MDRIRSAGGPGRNQGGILPFYPSDEFLIALTNEFNAEMASVFTMGINTHYLYAGTIDSIILPISAGPNFEILIKHTHPKGTPQPSIHDIEWLAMSQDYGSPQVKSIILPIGRTKTTFNRNTPHV